MAARDGYPSILMVGMIGVGVVYRPRAPEAKGLSIADVAP